MKYAFLLLLASALLLTGCDEIEHPVKPTFEFDTSLFPGPGFYEIPEFGPFVATHKNILLEDFTGHLCPTCPNAATIAHDLKEEHNGRVIVASIHSGPPGSEDFQKLLVEGEPGYPGFQHDFRTPAGEQYADDIPSLIANPSACINRIPPAPGITSLFTGQGVWPLLVDNIITADELLEVDLQVQTNYYPETKGLFVHIQSKALIDSDRDLFVVAYLIDDEILDWQKDGTQYIEFYSHKDVLLDNINGTYGEAMYSGSATNGELFQHDYSYEISSDINDDGLSIIAYIMDFDTFEVLQVVEKHI